jgi:hypothetical protein
MASSDYIVVVDDARILKIVKKTFQPDVACINMPKL